MKKRAIVILQYEDEQELNKFLAENGNAVVNVSGVHENLDAADIEHIEDFLEQEILPVEEE